MIIHVAPGTAQGKGTVDQPFSTLQAALDAVTPEAAEKRIILHGGEYLNTSVSLLPRHSGLTLESAPGARPRLVGGHRLSSWEREGDWITALVPADSNGRIPAVRSLLVNGRLAPRSRYPESGTLTHERVFLPQWMSTTAGGWERKPTPSELTTLQYREGDLGGWLNSDDAEFTVYHQWDESTVGVAAIDTVNRIITFSSPCQHPPGAFAFQMQNPNARRYVIANIREGMTRPGQWYFDRRRGRIVYWPQPGEELENLDIIAPVHTSIIALNGTNGTVSGITLRGIELCGTTTVLKAAGFGASGLEAAISGVGAVEDLTIDRLFIHDTGGMGIKIAPATLTDGTSVRPEGIRVSGCSVLRCGGSGMQINAARTQVEDCAVLTTGILYPSALALSVQSAEGRVLHCLVADCPYTALHGGGRNMTFESNLIRDFMRELDDGAAIYTFAGDRTVHRGNLALGTSGRLAHAYYLDERSTESVVEQNVAINTRWPSHNHMARACAIRDNLFLDGGAQKITLMKCEDFSFTGNTLVAEGEIEIHAMTGGLASVTGNRMLSVAGSLLLIRLGANGYSGEETQPLPWKVKPADAALLALAREAEPWRSEEVLAVLRNPPGPRIPLPHEEYGMTEAK